MQKYLKIKWLTFTFISLFSIVGADISHTNVIAHGEEHGHGGAKGHEEHHAEHPNVSHHNEDYHGNATRGQEARAFNRGAEAGAANSGGAGVIVVPQDPNLQYGPNGNDNWGQ